MWVFVKIFCSVIQSTPAHAIQSYARLFLLDYKNLGDIGVDGRIDVNLKAPATKSRNRSTDKSSTLIKLQTLSF